MAGIGLAGLVVVPDNALTQGLTEASILALKQEILTRQSTMPLDALGAMSWVTIDAVVRCPYVRLVRSHFLAVGR